MKIERMSLHPYTNSMKDGRTRAGILIHLVDERRTSGWGESAPLPGWSLETYDEAWQQLLQKKEQILQVNWMAETCLEELQERKLFPSVQFGLESALLSILRPLPSFAVETSALLMGSVEAILEQAKLRHAEGYTSAKLKVGALGFDEAKNLIQKLKGLFRLRIDVNRAWATSDSLRFFSQFPLDAFDYVEEPFQDPHDLSRFPHPLAVDESFTDLQQLEALPTLKALIYKPTVRGGLTACLPLHAWTQKRRVDLVLSSSFESEIGLAHIAGIAHRLSLTAPIGIGTHAYLTHCPLHFSGSLLEQATGINSG